MAGTAANAYKARDGGSVSVGGHKSGGSGSANRSKDGGHKEQFGKERAELSLKDTKDERKKFKHEGLQYNAIRNTFSQEDMFEMAVTTAVHKVLSRPKSAQYSDKLKVKELQQQQQQRNKRGAIQIKEKEGKKPYKEKYLDEK